MYYAIIKPCLALLWRKEGEELLWPIIFSLIDVWCLNSNFHFLDCFLSALKLTANPESYVSLPVKWQPNSLRSWLHNHEYFRLVRTLCRQVYFVFYEISPLSNRYVKISQGLKNWNSRTYAGKFDIILIPSWTAVEYQISQIIKIRPEFIRN